MRMRRICMPPGGPVRRSKLVMVLDSLKIGGKIEPSASIGGGDSKSTIRDPDDGMEPEEGGPESR